MVEEIELVGVLLWKLSQGKLVAVIELVRCQLWRLSWLKGEGDLVSWSVILETESVKIRSTTKLH